MATSPENALNTASVRVALHGEIDMVTAESVVSAVEDALVPGVPITVDLADVRFLDGRGVTALVMAQASAAALGSALQLVDAQPIVRRVLEISGLHPA
ncbi:STAS domain-containing protein [Cryptosporangium phraense]|uniref:STAS domain-containing protein n=1 Tax=Cryptosporangium phraense TaxID=2593070 RepID=A0A545AJ26_9ACTN|nr:STAS domain-containing protein [Cryptosporangium phraense]TQS41313.1 STAS domain-containing protein [Cryptosporangium phraense]